MNNNDISIHTLRMEGDSKIVQITDTKPPANPTILTRKAITSQIYIFKALDFPKNTGANTTAKLCELAIRTKKSTVLQP